MNWMEMIQLRSAWGNRQLLKLKLEALIKEGNMDREKQSIRIYNRKMIDTDFSILLYNNMEMTQSGGSRLGLRLADALRAFGLVRHSIWVEM